MHEKPTSEDQSRKNIINLTSSTSRAKEGTAKRSKYHGSTTGLEFTAWLLRPFLLNWSSAACIKYLQHTNDTESCLHLDRS